MPAKLRVRLRPGWLPAENPTIPTYKRAASADSGAQQFYMARFRHGTAPDVTEQTLVALCEKLTTNVRGRRDVVTASGTILGSVTVDDLVFYCAIAIGAAVAFVLLEIVPKLPLKHNLN